MTTSCAQISELSHLASDMYAAFGSTDNREAFGMQLLDALQEHDKRKRAVGNDDKRMRAYFENDVFQKGNARLRKEDTVIEGHEWFNYCRSVLPGELDRLKPALRSGRYFRRTSPLPGVDRKSSTSTLRPFPCFQADDWSESTSDLQVRTEGTIDFWAWAPTDLLRARDSIEARRFRIPLPPRNIGRDYSLAEACLALAAIYVANGSFPRLWDEDLEQRLSGRAVWEAALAQAAKNACVDWAPPLRALLNRITEELPVIKKRKRGRKPATFETAKAESDLLDKWHRAHDNRVMKVDFAHDQNMTLREFDKLLQRVRKRRYRADK